MVTRSGHLRRTQTCLGRWELHVCSFVFLVNVANRRSIDSLERHGDHEKRCERCEQPEKRCERCEQPGLKSPRSQSGWHISQPGLKSPRSQGWWHVAQPGPKSPSLATP